jgi:nitronate monooxygenase
MADQRYKDMLVACSADDVFLTSAFTGLQTNMLRPSLVSAGIDPDSLPEGGAIDISKDVDIAAHERRPTRWRDVWSAGHSTSGVLRVLSVADLISQTWQSTRRHEPRRFHRSETVGARSRRGPLST